MTKNIPNNIQDWERAEIERSESDARRFEAASLRFTKANIARYLNPPADTAFPTEYCFHLLGDIRNKIVLDFGCGDGENTLMLALRGGRVLAMDISTALIKTTQRRLDANDVVAPVGFFAGSGHAIPLSDESVDVVLGAAILHHLDLQLAAREVKRVLRTGGHAVFVEPVRNSPLLRRLRAMVPYTAPNVSPFERPLTDLELRSFAAGYKTFEMRAFALPYIGVASAVPFLQRWVSSLYRLDSIILTALPSLDYWATIKVLRVVK